MADCKSSLVVVVIVVALDLAAAALPLLTACKHHSFKTSSHRMLVVAVQAETSLLVRKTLPERPMFMKQAVYISRFVYRR